MTTRVGRAFVVADIECELVGVVPVLSRPQASVTETVMRPPGPPRVERRRATG